MGTDSWQIVAQGQPRVIKLLDSFSGATAIKQQAPGIVIIGRIYQEQQPTSGDPKAAAQAWLARPHRRKR